MINLNIDRYSSLSAHESAAPIFLWQSECLNVIEDLARGDLHGLTAAKQKFLLPGSSRRNF